MVYHLLQQIVSRCNGKIIIIDTGEYTIRLSQCEELRDEQKAYRMHMAERCPRLALNIPWRMFHLPRRKRSGRRKRW